MMQVTHKLLDWAIHHMTREYKSLDAPAVKGPVAALPKPVRALEFGK